MDVQILGSAFNGFVQLGSAVQIFSFCTIMHPPTKLKVFAKFWPQKMLHPVLSRFISARLFSVPQVENEVKRTPLCECCWDPSSRNWWIREVPKRGIFDSFLETVRPRKFSIYSNAAYFELKKDLCLPHISSNFKISILKIWTALCIYVLIRILRRGYPDWGFSVLYPLL